MLAGMDAVGHEPAASLDSTTDDPQGDASAPPGDARWVLPAATGRSRGAG